MERTEVETEIVNFLADLFGSERFGILERAHAFATYVVPSKAFVDLPETTQLAEFLIDKLEAEISAIKAGTDTERDAKLVAARQYKKDMKGFLVYERKHA